jgi:hypothetical protein
MRRRFAVLAALLLLGACLPQQRPSTASPPTASPTTAAPPADIGLPPPDGARRSDRAIARGAVGTRAASALAVPPGADERPERPKVAAVEPPQPNDAPPALPVTRPATRPVTRVVTRVVTRPEPVLPPAPPPMPAPAPARQATPAQTAAAAPITAPVEPPLAAPGGAPLTTVLFAPGSADLSDSARLALDFFAHDPATQRLRRIELWAWAGDDDPVEARKIAFACALAVHAYLIDLGVKARIEIGGFAEMLDASPNRVELRPGR